MKNENTLSLKAYVEEVKEQVKATRGTRSSKVEKDIFELVTGLIAEKKPTTIKAISEALNKPTQQIHQVLAKSKSLKKVKVEEGKRDVLVVPSEMN